MKNTIQHRVTASDGPAARSGRYRTIETLHADLSRATDENTSWAKLAIRYGVAKATLHKIYTTTYEPTSATIRACLGLAPMVFGGFPACASCGQVHTTKRCTLNVKPRPVRVAVAGRWSDQP